MRYWLLLLITACKFSASPSDTHTTYEDNMIVNLDVSPAGISLDVNGSPPLQRFFRAYIAEGRKFETADIKQPRITGNPIAFEQLIFAWNHDRNTYTCILEEVMGSMRIYPKVSCNKQDANEDYLHRFVEWCVQDNVVNDQFKKYYNGNWYCRKAKVDPIKGAVIIPFHCFKDEGNSCFPPTKDKFEGSRISRYLSHQQYRGDGSQFTDMLEELYAQIKSCGDPSTYATGSFCRCGEEKTITLFDKNRQPVEKKCKKGRYHHFSTFVPAREKKR